MSRGNPRDPIVLLLCVAFAAAACLQASPARASAVLTGGAMGYVGGSSSSASVHIVGEGTHGVAEGRSSGPSTDVIGGQVGASYASRMGAVFPTGAGSYSLVAVPLTSTSDNPVAVFPGLGAYNNTAWRLGHWLPGSSAYAEPGTANGLSHVVPGQGYWLITKGAAAAGATGLPVAVTDFKIALAPIANGENQLGNPFVFPVDVSKLTVTDGVTTYLLTDPANTFTEQVVKTWNSATSSYTTPAVIPARQGFWVKTLTATQITLTVPFSAALPIGSYPAAGPSLPHGASWAVSVTARQGDRRSEPMLLGAAPVAASGRNALSLSRTPSPPTGEFLSLHVPIVNTAGVSTDYVHAFQPAAAQMSWTFELTGAEAPGELALDVAGLGLPDGSQLQLTDLVNGTTRPVTPGQPVSLMATSDARRFRIDATVAGGAAGLVTFVDGLRAAYPNPFGSTIGLAFTLAKVGDLSVEVYDLMGRRVTTLGGKGLAAGEHVLVWDGTASDGHPVAAGVYLARYRAGTREGVRRLVRIR